MIVNFLYVWSLESRSQRSFRSAWAGTIMLKLVELFRLQNSLKACPSSLFRDKCFVLMSGWTRAWHLFPMLTISNRWLLNRSLLLPPVRKLAQPPHWHANTWTFMGMCSVMTMVNTRLSTPASPSPYIVLMLNCVARKEVPTLGLRHILYLGIKRMQQIFRRIFILLSSAGMFISVIPLHHFLPNSWEHATSGDAHHRFAKENNIILDMKAPSLRAT